MRHLILFESYSNENEILYHGTNKEFKEFTLDNLISNPTYNMDSSDNGLGIFFTDNLTMAKWFADLVEYDDDGYKNTGKPGKVIKATVNLQNPWILSEQVNHIDEDDPGQTYFDTVEKMGGGKKMRTKLQSMCYDGVVVEDMNTNYYEDGSYKIVVAFDPSQITIT